MPLARPPVGTLRRRPPALDEHGDAIRAWLREPRGSAGERQRRLGGRVRSAAEPQRVSTATAYPRFETTLADECVSRSQRPRGGIRAPPRQLAPFPTQRS